MGLPTFVGAGTGAAITTGTATISKTGCTAGNVVLMHMYVAGTSDDGSRSAITNITSIDGAAGDLNHTEWRDVGAPTVGLHILSIGRATANGTCSVDWTVGASGEDTFARIYEFSGAITSSVLTAVIENDMDTHEFTATTDATPHAVTVLTNGVNRLALACLAVAGNQAIAEYTGEVGGDWFEPVSEFASATGATATLSLQIANMTAAGVLSGGECTISASTGWGIQGLALVGTPNGGGGGGGGPSNAARMLTMGVG